MKFSSKVFLITGRSLLLFNKTYSQHTKQTIIIENIENVKGDLYLGWYKESDEFRINDKAIYRDKIKVANQSEATVNFENIPMGRYAIAVFLDENGNYKLDKNLFGIPVEKYGFSNNVIPLFRPATFEESAFVLEKSDMVIKIYLK